MGFSKVFRILWCAGGGWGVRLNLEVEMLFVPADSSYYYLVKIKCVSRKKRKVVCIWHISDRKVGGVECMVEIRVIR